MPLLEVEHLQKVYTARFGAVQVEALRDVNFTVEAVSYTHLDVYKRQLQHRVARAADEDAQPGRHLHRVLLVGDIYLSLIHIL